MNKIRLYLAVVPALVVLSACNALAQEDKRGDVVIRSDARLAVLIRKNHSYVRLTTPEPSPKIAEVLPAPKLPPVNTYTGPTGLVHHDQKTVYNGRGYRVQIYNGPSRDKAIAVKTEFMRRFPGVHTYFVFVAPGFRVKIGDYRNRGDAEGMLREANSMFGTSMIVPEESVTVSTY